MQKRGVIYARFLPQIVKSKSKLRLRTARAPTTIAAPRLHRSSPNFCQGKRTPSPTKPANRFERAQPEIKKSSKTQGGVFRNSPQGRGRRTAGTLHSGHEADSKRKHSNHPPPGNKTPNCRAADRGKNQRERGGRRRMGKREGKEGSALSGRKELQMGRERERGGP